VNGRKKCPKVPRWTPRPGPGTGVPRRGNPGKRRRQTSSPILYGTGEVDTRKPEHSHAPRATSTQRVRGALLLSHLAQSASRFCTAHTQFLPFNCPLPFALCPLPSATSLMLCTLPACALFPPPFTCRPPAADCWPLAYAPWALPVGLCLAPACRLLPLATCPLASGRCPLAFACWPPNAGLLSLLAGLCPLASAC